jgi:hypothetical protein
VNERKERDVKGEREEGMTGGGETIREGKIG